MVISEVKENKKRYMDLLLISAESENMINRYLERGTMYVLNDKGITLICIVTNESNDILEIKNIVTVSKYQNYGYGKEMIKFIADKYRNEFTVLQVKTGSSLSVISFYEKCGFKKSHKVKNFFVDNYEKLIYEQGIQLIDIIYLTKSLK